MDLIENHKFQEIFPRIIAVADERDDAPGLLKAKEKGLFVTNDYNVFFERNDINLIMELTGHQNVYNDILMKKKKTVRAIDHNTSLLFWEISRVSSMQQKTREELREKRALCDVVMNDLIQEDIMIIGSNYHILDINDSMLRRLGLKLEDALGRYCYEITHHQEFPCSGENHPCPLVQTLETLEASQTTHIHLDQDKNEIYYSISCYPLFEDDKVIGALEISKDISEDIRMQKIMMQQEKLASIGRLSAGVAHEINNPLTTILTTAMLIQEEMDADDPDYEELGLIANETLRCRKIVSNLLDFARQTKPEKKQNDVNQMVMESILLVKKQAAFNDVAVEHSFSEDMPTICADKGQIQQALINLILNSVEATPPGGKVTVPTVFSPKSRGIEIVESDTGEDIDQEKVDKIFDPLFTT
ncbi:MAG: histidine kinase, partial [Deltaproteobacteria bacterium]